MWAGGGASAATAGPAAATDVTAATAAASAWRRTELQNKGRDRIVAYCQTLTSNSGCSLPVESLICSSMYLGSVLLSNLIVAPRL